MKLPGEAPVARCLIALGSNLGDRRSIFSQAVHELSNLSSCQLLARSRWAETTPIGGPSGQQSFLNGAVLLDTSLSPFELAGALRAIELQLGRKRVVRWDARTIDLDLLLYGDRLVQSPELTVPHPRMSFRRFVLEPACDIAGDMCLPTVGWTLRQLLRHLQFATRYVVVTAPERAWSERVANEICQFFSSPRLESCELSRELGGDLWGGDAVESGDWPTVADWQRSPDLASRLSEVPPIEKEGIPPVVSILSPEALMAFSSTPSSGPVAQKVGQFGLRKWAEEDSVRPALVIALESPAAADLPATSIPQELPKSLSPRMSLDEFRECLDRPGTGPIAHIGGYDFHEVLSGATAAIQAVWPDLAQ